MWEFFCNAEGEVWVAYCHDTYTAHVLLDERRGLYDPDPKIPQHVIEAWRTCRELGYSSGLQTKNCGGAFIND